MLSMAICLKQLYSVILLIWVSGKLHMGPRLQLTSVLYRVFESAILNHLLKFVNKILVRSAVLML